jgi:hypothetical protein
VDQYLQTRRARTQAKLRGRRPKSWLIEFRKRVESGLEDGYDHIQRQSGSRSSPTVAETLLSALKPAASERAREVRSSTLNGLDRTAAGKKGGRVRADSKYTEAKKKVDAFRASHPKAIDLVACRVARWWVQTHEGKLEGQERTKAIRKLTRQLYRRKLAS